uniref:Sorbitol dehydrogenase n=1 Tax=Glossina pallidipes TaxID=7398 RepID=A0A1A9ZA91_GLOPL
MLTRFSAKNFRNCLKLFSNFQRNFSANDKKKGNKKSKNNKSDKGKGDKPENLAVVLHAKQDLKMETKPIAKIEPKEVLLAMDCVGICGTDILFWQGGKLGPVVVKDPLVLGHEASGVVCEIGKDVKDLKVGDRVAIEPGTFCRNCRVCRQGRYNLCPFMKFPSYPPTDGLLQRYFKQNSDMCHKLPDHLTMEAGALCEPLAVGVAGARRAKVKLNSNVLIVGSGPAGLATSIVCQAIGASKVMVIDKKEDRLEMAKGFGNMTMPLVDSDGKDLNKTAKKIHDCMGCIPDKVFDCHGSQETFKLAIRSTGWGGTCCLIGMASGNFTDFPLMDDVMREVLITANFRYCNDFPAAMAIAANSKYDLLKMITHHIEFDDALCAFDTALKQEPGTMKVMVHFVPQGTNNPKKKNNGQC